MNSSAQTTTHTTRTRHPRSRVRAKSRTLAVGIAAALALTAGACSGTSGPATPTTQPPTSTSAGPASTPATTPTTSAPVVTEPPAPSTTAPEPTSVGALVTVPVYVVGEVSPTVGPRLYREWRQVALLPGGRIQTAVQAMIDLTPIDPDYRSLWPVGTTVRSVTRSGATATVDLSGYLTNLGAAYEAFGVAQLVHTVTAADPTVTAVRLLVRGATPPSGHLDLSTAQTRGDPLSTIAHVWILQPTQGATVHSPVQVQVYGTGFEGNVPLKVFRGGTEVASAAVLTMMGGFAVASTTFTLPPGSYELRAYNDSPKDGSLQVWDTKTFTVS